MVFLEIVFVFFGWNYGIFNGTFVDSIGVWDIILCYCICVYDLYLCQGIDLWRSSCWLAVYDVYYLFNWWGSTALHWYYGAVYE